MANINQSPPFVLTTAECLALKDDKVEIANEV